jgi:hypothetical protein
VRDHRTTIERILDAAGTRRGLQLTASDVQQLADVMIAVRAAYAAIRALSANYNLEPVLKSTSADGRLATERGADGRP